MIVEEKKANKHMCPMEMSGSNNYKCQGSKCMAWRWIDEHTAIDYSLPCENGVPLHHPRLLWLGREAVMTDITIPPEAVDEAARAMCETENGPCECLPDECGCTYWKAHATAALRAGIAAWPGMVKNYSWDASHGRIILPLPQEPRDE